MEFLNYIYKNTEYFEKRDLVKRLKNALLKEDIQLLLQLDCEKLTLNEIEATVKKLNKDYSLAGVILSQYNLNYSDLKMVKEEIKEKKYWLGAHLENAEQIPVIAQGEEINLYLADEIREDEYNKLKSDNVIRKHISQVGNSRKHLKPEVTKRDI